MVSPWSSSKATFRRQMLPKSSLHFSLVVQRCRISLELRHDGRRLGLRYD